MFLHLFSMQTLTKSPFRTVTFNTVVVNPIVILGPILWAMKWRHQYKPLIAPEYEVMILPEFHWAIIELIIFVLVEEIAFYYSHRLLHHKKVSVHLRQLKNQGKQNAFVLLSCK